MNALLLRRAGLAAAAAALAAILVTLATRATPPSPPPPSLVPAAPVASAAPADPAEWHEKARQPDVSAGVLVRVASRRPLDRDLACAPATPPDGAGARPAREAAGSAAASVARCTPGVDEIEDVEIDWNGTKPVP